MTKMKANINFKSVCLFLFSVGLSSCKQFVEVPQPINQLDANAVFTDDATAIAAVVPNAGTGRASCFFKCSAMRNDRATRVKVGLAWLDVGNVAAPLTNKLLMPWTRQSASTTLEFGSLPMRAVPM